MNRNAPLPESCDLLIVGGGINGAGIARDAAGRGLSVVLCERDDLAAHTSSASTKLIHGGLRYLEYREFGLVRKALQEREVLMKIAPHLIAPLRFVIPLEHERRPAWMIRAGLFLYDRLARREILPGSQAIDLRTHPAGAPLATPLHRRAFSYFDARCDDARLVVANALDAAERGANVSTRTACRRATRRDGLWEAQLSGAHETTTHTIRARALVNAAGPWAADFGAGVGSTRTLRLVRGSHIVVPRRFEHEDAYLFQHTDRRVVFAIPYQKAFTLIGTTDVDHPGEPGAAQISDDESDYLIALANSHFKCQLTRADIVWSYSGVRPLLDDESADAKSASRDYALECPPDDPPVLHVWGGKITTYRKLAEEAVDTLAARLKHAEPAWTATAPLPGGDLERPGKLIARYDPDAYAQALAARYPELPAGLVQRYAHCYGTRATRLLEGVTRRDALGAEPTPGLFEIEVRYLMEYEWAQTAEDILWRRTKLGLFCPSTARAALVDWMANAAQT